MKRWMIVVLLIVVAAIAGTFRGRSGRWTANPSAVASEQREEIRQSYPLQAGAKVEIRGINGSVQIETNDSSTAEIYIERTAQNAEDLAGRKLIIENTPQGLVIRGEQTATGFWQQLWHGDVRDKLTLKLPRQIALVVRGVNGSVSTGEIDGAVKINGVGGNVETAQVTGASEISGVNGSVTVAVRQLGKDGLRIKGINGAVELRFTDKVNADFEAHGINGKVNAELPDVAVNGEQNRSNYAAKIGAGGAPIIINGVNGNIHLARAGV